MGEPGKTNGKKVYLNPYAEYGAEIPNWLLRRREITPGAKVVYGQLMQIFYEPPMELGPRVTGSVELADDLGMDTEHVNTYLRELIVHKLIDYEAKDGGYVFFPLENEWHNEMLFLPAEKLADEDCYHGGVVVRDAEGAVYEEGQS